MIAQIGQLVKDSCFGRDMGSEVLRIEAVGYDWVVARPVSEYFSEKYGPCFAHVDPSYVMRRWSKSDETDY